MGNPIFQVSSGHPVPFSKQQANSTDKLRNAAVELESTFLAEMLKAAGFDKAGVGFGGDGKPSEFGTFLVREYAREMARSGGIGLAESLYQSLKEQSIEQS